MSPLIVFFLLLQSGATPQAEPVNPPSSLAELLRAIEQSGRVLTLARPREEELRLAPGAPPLLTFRYLEGRKRGRFGNLDLVLDDAGH
jgi:hypothetical protein